MKKLTGVLTILAVMAGMMMMSGCELFNAVKDYYKSTYDVWYLYNKEVNVEIAEESETATDGILNDAKVYVKFKPEYGMDVLVCTTKEQSISYLGGAYEVKANLTTGGTKHYDEDEKINRGTWIAMVESGKFTRQDPPKIDVDLDTLMKGNFNLRRLLLKLLTNYLE